MQPKLTLLLAITFMAASAGAQNVGIGTTTPKARLHITDSAVLFTGPAIVPAITSYPPPASGAGSRMMWYPQKAAFRAGNVDLDAWDKDNIGAYSFATGFNTKALGIFSSSMGAGSIASGNSASSMGYYTKAKSNNSLAIGIYNDTTSVLNDRLFEIGNGAADNARSNAFTVLTNGNIGLGNVTAPTAALQFASTNAAKKLVLWQNNIASNAFAGIGNSTGNMLYQAGDVFNDHVFSTYAGSGSNEIMRIKGTGKVGILVSNPASTLEVGGRIRLFSNIFDGGTSGIWFRNNANNTDAALLSMENDQGIGIRSGNILRFFVNSATGNVGIGNPTPVAPLTFSNSYGDKIVLADLSATGQYAIRIQPLLLQLGVPTVNDEISLGYGTSAGFTDKLRIKANGNVGIGTSTPLANLEVVSKSLWSQLTLASTNTPGYGKIDFVSDYGQVNQWRPAYIISDDAGNFTGALNFYTNGTGIANRNGSVLSLKLQNGVALTSTGTVGVFSDARLKQNITPFTDGLNVLDKINPVQFQYKPDAPFVTNEPQVGVLAQELEKAAPYMVHQTTENGITDMRWVNNQAYIFLLINSVKTLEAQIRQQQLQIQTLIEKVEKLSNK